MALEENLSVKPACAYGIVGETAHRILSCSKHAPRGGDQSATRQSARRRLWPATASRITHHGEVGEILQYGGALRARDRVRRRGNGAAISRSWRWASHRRACAECRHDSIIIAVRVALSISPSSSPRGLAHGRAALAAASNRAAVKAVDIINASSGMPKCAQAFSCHATSMSYEPCEVYIFLIATYIT